MGEEKETRDRVRLSALICITQLLLGSSAIGRVQVGKKEPAQAIRGKLRLISFLWYRAAGSFVESRRGAYDATGEQRLGSLTSLTS